MLLKEFQTFKCSHFSQVPFSIVWSEDNMIAQACENTIYLAEYISSPRVSFPMLNFERDSITLKRLHPTLNCGVDIAHLTRVLGEKDLYDLLQTSHAYPLVSASQREPIIKQIAWSPLIEPHQRSTLAVLTDAGALTLCSLVKGTWVTSSVLTESWCQFTLKNYPKIDESSPASILESLKSRTSAVKITCFCWGKNNIFGERNTNTLYICSMSGTIGIWQVEASPIKLVSKIPEILLVQVIHSNIHYPSSIIQDPRLASDNKVATLYISGLNGQVSKMELEGSADQVTMKSQSFVWEEEDKVTIPPGGLYTIPFKDSTYLIGAKGPFILVAVVDSRGEIVLREILRTDSLNVTGFAKISDQDVLVVTTEGALFNLKLSDNIMLMRVQKSLRSSHYACQGLAVSGTGFIVALAFSLCGSYNHLVLRETSAVVLAALSDVTDGVTLLLDRSQSITSITDALDVYRIHCILNKRGPEIFESRQQLDLDTCSIFDLQKYYWLIHCTIFTEDDPQVIDDLKLLRDEIMMILMFKNFESLVSKVEKNGLGEAEIEMLKAVWKWLDFFLRQLKPDCRSIQAAALGLKLNLNKLNLGEETCHLCLSKIGPFEKLLVSHCEEKHEVPRCAISLAQYSSMYYKCPPCHTVATPWAAEKTDPPFVCITCGSYLRYIET